MTYFKAIQNDKVVSVGCVFLKWSLNKHKFFICDVDEGQFVESYDEQHIYQDSWMKPAPPEAGEQEQASIVIIGQQEYEDLLEMLNEGEIVEVQQEPTVEQEEQVELPVEDKPMSIADMREMILKQQQLIDTLMEKLQ